ncbi:MAG TPA: oxidative damage protection protein [Chloroflexaceae bacterium]|nr:oxidative damage protection protein [Chloroflexaceae bacterium]
MPRMVNCAKLGRELPGLERPPFPGPLGQRIYENISQQAYNLWPAQATLIINHYGLSLGDPNAQQILMQQMEEFFFGENARMPEGWTPQQARPAKGAPRRK